MPKSPNKYSIKNLSKEQLRLIQTALDLYSRCGLLQFENVIIDEIRLDFNKKTFHYLDNMQEIENHLGCVKNLLVKGNPKYAEYHGNNWSLSIGSDDTPKKVQLAYEMLCDIRDLLTKEEENETSQKKYSGVRGKIKLTNHEDIIVEVDNQRVDKIQRIIKEIVEKNK
jgi:hypothetical protein